MGARDEGCLPRDIETCAVDAAGVLFEVVVILMRRLSRGRSAGNEPAMMPMPSSIKDQNPIFPVP